MNPQEFAQRIKAKYPQYRNVEDNELTQKVISKYPVYASQVNLPNTEQAEPSLAERAGGVLGTIFGGEKIGEAIGTEIAKRRATPEEREFIEGPSKKAVAGDVLRTGALFAPIGRLAKGISAIPKALGLARGAETIGAIGAGAATGAAADIGVNLTEGQTPKIGLGTAIGTAIPATAPIARAFSKAVGKFGSEIQGALTGTSAETIEQAFLAAKTGGKQLEQFTSALRGRTTPEALVTGLRNNVAQVATKRSNIFSETLKELSDTVVKTDVAKRGFLSDLAETGITVGDDGLLNFANSKLRTVPNAQAKLQQAWQEIKNMPETLSIGELDTTRQAIKGIKSIAGDEPSSNLANMLIDDAVRNVRVAGEQIDGYGAMLDNFAETSEFLDEIQRGLSSGEKATIDTAYRKLATSLKTNNEQRMALLRELDEVTEGSILSAVSGQQLSETLPRGIFRQIAAGIAGGSIITGGLSAQLLPALVFASPRATGEFVRALGLTAGKTQLIIGAVSDARNVLIKAGAISGAEISQ